MDLSILNSIIEMISADKWKRIKLIMKSAGAVYPGFANFEKVPTQFIKNDCINNKKTREEFLKALVEIYINSEALNIDKIPSINGDNFIGVVSLMLLRNVDIKNKLN